MDGVFKRLEAANAVTVAKCRRPPTFCPPAPLEDPQLPLTPTPWMDVTVTLSDINGSGGGDGVNGGFGGISGRDGLGEAATMRWGGWMTCWLRRVARHRALAAKGAGMRSITGWAVPFLSHSTLWRVAAAVTAAVVAATPDVAVATVGAAATWTSGAVGVAGGQGAVVHPLPIHLGAVVGTTAVMGVTMWFLLWVALA